MLQQLRDWVQRAAALRAVRIVRTGLLVAALLLGIALLVRDVDKYYPIRNWLFWRYCGYWSGAAFFSLACQCAGLPIVERLGKDFRASERLLLSQAVGTVLFFLGMFGFGVLHVYHPILFFLWPVLLTAFGAREAWRRGRRILRLRRSVARFRFAPISPLTSVALVFGLLCLAILYVQGIHPLNTSYDARWYHLSLAEQYVAERGIVRFPEGSYVTAYPQLTSFLYVWAFLLPNSVLFDKVELCAHMVFVLFLFILLGVALLSRRLLGKNGAGQRVRGVWAVVFLFPGLFVYDSGLHLGADHPAAFFAVPVALAAYMAYSRWTSRNWLLLGILVAGAALTKYSVAALFVTPGLVLGLRGVFKLVRGRFGNWREVLVPPLSCGLLLLLLTAPHWLKNWLFYGNPVYPYAASLFPHAPWGDYNRRVLETWSAGHEWTPHGTFGERFSETIHAVPKFAFVVHDWPAAHRDVPVFGFLFSLGGLALPFVRGRTTRVWVCVIASYVGVFLWYWGMHQDRYLQVLLPWMAAATAATLVLAWRSSHWAKLPVAALILVQVAWGSDTPMIPSSSMIFRPSILPALELVQSGYLGQTKNRLRVFEPYQSVGDALPDKARVLMHEHHLSLGIRHMVMSDFAHTQGLIDYGAKSSTQQIYDMLKGMGVTHILWISNTSLGWSGYAGDFAFFDFVRSHTRAPRSFGNFSLAELAPGPSVDLKGAKAAFFACGNGYKMGLYSLSSMSFPDIVVTNKKAYPKPERLLGRHGETAESLVEAARYVAFDPNCGVAQPPALARDFTRLANRSTIGLWARK